MMGTDCTRRYQFNFRVIVAMTLKCLNVQSLVIAKVEVINKLKGTEDTKGVIRIRIEHTYINIILVITKYGSHTIHG